MVLVLGVLLPVVAGCKRKEALPAVEGAARVLSADQVYLFKEIPVSTREFDSEDRRWSESTTPRFENGRVHRLPHPEAGMVMAELPPRMAFRNRGNDCGPAEERRICPIPWEDVEITICGRLFDGNLEVTGDRLDRAGFIVCRLVDPPETLEDGTYRPARRDCTRAPRIGVGDLRPGDLIIRAGDLAVVPPAGRGSDAACRKLEELYGPPPAAGNATR
jgi:hypothetical protein